MGKESAALPKRPCTMYHASHRTLCFPPRHYYVALVWSCTNFVHSAQDAPKGSGACSRRVEGQHKF